RRPRQPHVHLGHAPSVPERGRGVSSGKSDGRRSDMAESRASALWQGDLGSGSGRVSVASGAFPEQAVTWAARTNRPDPKTSPEELIAAAHAACYAMAFAHALAEAGHVPEQVAVDP